MIYSDCIFNHNKITNTEVVKISIMRFKPPNINFIGANIIDFSVLAPSIELLNGYKYNKFTFAKFSSMYYNELKNDISKFEAIRELLRLNKKYTVILYCCEENNNKCHRRLLLILLSKLTGIEFREMEESDYERCNKTI